MRLALPLGLLCCFGCGMSPGNDPGHLGDAGVDAGGTNTLADAGGEDAGVADAGGMDAGAADAGVVASPVVTSVTLVTHGTMRISWTLPAAGCSSIVLAMKSGVGGTYSNVSTLSGTAITTQHSPGHSSGTYCYRVLCLVGGAGSDPSNEKCASQ